MLESQKKRAGTETLGGNVAPNLMTQRFSKPLIMIESSRSGRVEFQKEKEGLRRGSEGLNGAENTNVEFMEGPSAFQSEDNWSVGRRRETRDRYFFGPVCCHVNSRVI